MLGRALLACLLLVAAPARAQGPARETAEAAPAPAALVLRPAAGLRDLARRAARILARRARADVQVGEAPPPQVAEAVPEGHLALVEQDGRVRLVLAGPGGVTWQTQLELPRRRGDAAARAVVLAIESLRDAAAEGPPPESEPVRASRWTRWILVGGLPRGGSIEPIAKPTIYLRALLGVSPLRGTILVGPGTGLGLCVTVHCLVIEGDLPLVPEVRNAVRYQPVNFSLRVQLRPFRLGDFAPGLTAGFLTRIGLARLEGSPRATVATNLGLRGTLELAYRFAPRFELVLEAGLDFAIQRAAFLRHHEDRTIDTVFLEDRWTPWTVLSVRLRPEAD